MALIRVKIESLFSHNVKKKEREKKPHVHVTASFIKKDIKTIRQSNIVSCGHWSEPKWFVSWPLLSNSQENPWSVSRLARTEFEIKKITSLKRTHHWSSNSSSYVHSHSNLTRIDNCDLDFFNSLSLRISYKCAPFLLLLSCLLTRLSRLIICSRLRKQSEMFIRWEFGFTKDWWNPVASVFIEIKLQSRWQMKSCKFKSFLSW